MRQSKVTHQDLSAHLVASACQLRARDELLQQAMVRVRRTGTTSAEDWQALAEGVEASLRVPASTLLLLGTYVEGLCAEGGPCPAQARPGLRERLRRSLLALLGSVPG